MYSSRKYKRAKYCLDIISLILVALVLACAIFIVININKHIKFLPFVFLFGALLNIFSGIRDILSEKKAIGITLCVLSLIFIVAFVIATITFW